MGIEDKLRDAAKDFGKKMGDLAKEQGDQIVGELKGKLATEVEELKQKAAKAAANIVKEQKDKLSDKASKILKKT